MRRSLPLPLLALLTLASSATDADAGGLLRRRDRSVTPAQAVRTTVAPAQAPAPARPDNRVAPSPMLGSFMPGNYITVRSNGFQGGGYSPIGFYGGNNSMDVYGPISALRATSAPVNTVVRGYNGAPVVVEGTSFSTPFLPEASPVRYPTRASNYSAIRDAASAPRSGSGLLWVDQN